MIMSYSLWKLHNILILSLGFSQAVDHNHQNYSKQKAWNTVSHVAMSK